LLLALPHIRAIIRARFMDAAKVIGLLIIAVILFATEKISVDLVTLGLLCALVLMGIITPNEAFAGFGQDMIIMLGSIFVIGAALRETGVLDSVGHVLARTTGGNPKRIIAGMMSTVGGISAFMNNTTVTAMFLGPIIGLARRLHISPSRLLMPLAFSSILGGTCTLIGTSTNLAVSGAMKKLGMEPIAMFEITPVGIALFTAGLFYMLLVGARWLPDRDRPEADGASTPIREYLCEVVILPGSPIIGQEVYASDFSVMEFQVVKIRRGDQDIEVGPHVKLQKGDVVLVAGKVQNLIRVKKIEGIDILEDIGLRSSGVEMKDTSIVEVVLTPKSSLVGQSLRSSNFRRRSGLSVLALLRGDRTLSDHMADVPLEAGDMLLLQGAYDRIRVYEGNSEMVVISEHTVSQSAQKRGIAVLVVFALAVLLSSLDLIPTSIAFLLVALVALATRCMTLDAAYENVDWRLLILIGGMTAFGTAMSKSGADQVLAQLILGWLQPYGAIAVLAGFSLLTVILTQPMSNAAAALVVLPVALQAAETMHASPRAFAITVMLSASISLLTPFEPSCILVYGPGKYRFSDFIKVGGGLTILTVLLILWLVPLRWPL
jgi:di/tricarboxylate transporter